MSSSNEVSYVHYGSFKHGMNILIPILVIRSVSDVLRAQSRFVKFVVLLSHLSLFVIEYGTSNLIFDNSILFYLANFLFYSILHFLFCILFYLAVQFSIMLYSVFYSIIYSILFYLARYSILFYFVFYSVNFTMQNPKLCAYFFFTSLIVTFYRRTCTL